MAKPLQFLLNAETFDGVPVKLERSKLYGHVDTVATDAAGGVCVSASLDSTGTLVIPPGAIKNGTVDEKGFWHEKSELTALDAEGNPAEVRPSSFDAPIELSKKVSEEEFLDHIWNSVYQIVNPDLAVKLGNDIYMFPFNYRAGTGNDDGFLMAANGLVYLYSGDAVKFDYLGLAEEAVLDDPAQEEEIEEDDLSFDMM